MKLKKLNLYKIESIKVSIMSSKRTFQRNVRKERQLLLNRKKELAQDYAQNFVSSVVHEPTFETPSSPGSPQGQNLDFPNLIQNSPQTLRQKLRNWYYKYSPTTKSCSSILKIMKAEGLDVPISVGGLLKRKQKRRPRTVAPGKYIHLGIENHLKKAEEVLLQYSGNEIVLDIGIDGLPLYKSSAVGLWPILARIVDEPLVDIFLVGTYVGKSKPTNVDHYLHDFVEELKSLETGLLIGEKVFYVRIRAFICDTPARAFICGTKGHNALNGCHKCYQKGTRIAHRTVFSDSVAEKRTDIDFKNRSDVDYHQAIMLHSESKLEHFGIQMVTQFPLDVMHLLDLGVCKKIFSLLISNKTNQPIPPSIQLRISSVLVSFEPYVVKEFARKPRTIKEICRWKAVEYRQISLYSGMVLLKDFVEPAFYEHFCLFIVSYRILIGSKIFNPNLSFINAGEMFDRFVKDFSLFYGIENRSYNIHNILHLLDCYENYGNLMNISAYDFENFLKGLKSSVRVPKHIDQQVYNKFIDRSIVLPPVVNNVANIKKKKVKSYFLNGFTYKTTSPDNFCCISNTTFLIISSISENGNFKGKKFKNVQSFFHNPISSLDIGIGFIDKWETENLENTFSLNDVTKIQLLPYREGAVLIPLLN